MAKTTVISIAVLACACAAVWILKTNAEGFSLAADVCDSLNPDSEVYKNSTRLQALCRRADSVNPDETCLVDCDVDSLCRNPSVGYCRKPRGADALCDVTDNHYGSHPENADLPRVYRVRRGVCLVATREGGVVDDANLRRALLRFPESVAIVGGGLGHESPFRRRWTVSLPASLSSAADDVLLPLVSHAFVQESAERARGTGVSAPVPSAVLHESCASPGGGDTSFSTEPVPLQERVSRAAAHENQPPSLHVTMRFTLPSTVRVEIGGPDGLVYESFTSGGAKTASPVSGSKLSVRTEVWLMLEVLPKQGRVGEAREVLVGSDGVVRISRAPVDKSIDIGSFVRFSGEPPGMWLGMRDAARDVALT